MDLPQHVQNALGVGSPITEDELIQAADEANFVQEIFGLSGEDFTAAVEQAISGEFHYSVSNALHFSNSWKILESSRDGVLAFSFVYTPKATQVAPPTAIGQLLVQAWISFPGVIVDNGIPSGLLVQKARIGNSLNVFTSRLATELGPVYPFFEGVQNCPSWIANTQLILAANTKLIEVNVSNLKYQHLFLEAVSETKSNWRFLSLYRILEHGYLVQVFESLKSTFFSAPKDSLAAATKSVNSEIKQFIGLVQAANLLPRFETLYTAFEALKANQNVFAHALQHSIDTGTDQIIGHAQTGVLICYKIRCAIVHAGLSAPIYDAYADGPAVLESILPICEAIALDFLGVTLH